MKHERSPADPITPCCPPNALRAGTAASPARVLLVEDDLEMRRLLASALRRAGHDVLEARDGFHVLEVLADDVLRGRRAPPDLIVSDIRMPRRSGLDVLAGIRRDGWRTPVLLISAFADGDTLNSAYRLGADVVLEKPFDIDDFLLVAGMLLDAGAPPEERGDGDASDRPGAGSR